MNPSLPNYGSHHQNPQVNPMEPFAGYPMFPQGHPIAFGLPPASQIPMLGMGSNPTPGSNGVPMHNIHIPPQGHMHPGTIPSHGQQIHNEKMSLALGFLDKVKLYYQNQPDVYNKFLDIMKDFKDHSIDASGVIQRVKKLFHGHQELVEGFNNFLPPPLKIDVPKEPSQEEIVEEPEDQNQQEGRDVHKAEFDHARSYVKKIKHRFSTQPHIYKAFLEILHTFSREQQSLSSVYEGVAALFKDHKDLLIEFKHFLPDTNAINTPEVAQMSQPSQKPRSQRVKSSYMPVDKKPIVPDSPPQTQPKISPRVVNNQEASYGTYTELSYFFRIKESLSEADYEEFLKVLSIYNLEIISKAELYYLVRDLLRYSDADLIDWFRKFINAEEIRDDDDPLGYLADFDWSRSDKLGPSYRSIPEKWKLWKCSGRIGNEICLQVLNDSWLSVPTGSEDGSFKNSRKNQYEELLFKLEDDRYELDLIVESNLSAIRFLDDLYMSIEQMSPEELSKFRLKESDIGVIQTMAIKRVYGQKSNEFLNLLFNKPAAAIPIILNRLKQKDIEWNLSRQEWNELWKEIAERNHYKSLDHQSVLFKQEEKKALLPKTLLSELRKKSAERKLKESTENITDQDLLRPPLLTSTLDIPHIFQDIRLLLLLTFESVLPKGNKTKFESIYDLIASFFNLPKTDNETKKSQEMVEQDSIFPECKPIFTSSETSKKQQKNLFLGNDVFFVMFSYYNILYERLRKAWDLAAQPEPKRFKPQTLVDVEKILLEDKQQLGEEITVKEEKSIDSPSKHDAESNSNPTTHSQSNSEDQTQMPDYQTKRYQQFLYNIELLLSNTIEQSTFEEKCRELFGNYAYSLFTIDKLLILLAKQIQNIHHDEATEKLIGLYHYENSRPNGFSDYVYLVNYREVLVGEKKAYVLSFDPESQILGFGDMDLTTAAMSTENNEELTRYVNNLAHENQDLKGHPEMKPPVFLKRTLRKENTVIDENNVDISYDLACKIMPDTYKLRFVENTQDYFHRRKKHSQN